MAIVVNLVYIYLIGGIADSVLVLKSLGKGGPGGAIYLPYLVLLHLAWLEQMGVF